MKLLSASACLHLLLQFSADLVSSRCVRSTFSFRTEFPWELLSRVNQECLCNRWSKWIDSSRENWICYVSWTRVARRRHQVSLVSWSRLSPPRYRQLWLKEEDWMLLQLRQLLSRCFQFHRLLKLIRFNIFADFCHIFIKSNDKPFIG